MQLSPAEEQLMRFIWKLKKSILKELRMQYPDPKPAVSTLATLLKRMQKKNYIGYITKGKSREYYPLVEKKAYRKPLYKGLLKNFFDNSSLELASYITTETELSESELTELKKLIDKQIKKKST